MWIDPMIVLWTVLEWYAVALIALLCIGALADWWVDP